MKEVKGVNSRLSNKNSTEKVSTTAGSSSSSKDILNNLTNTPTPRVRRVPLRRDPVTGRPSAAQRLYMTESEIDEADRLADEKEAAAREDRCSDSEPEEANKTKRSRTF
ncbi:hypothetical protein BV25DRAFT_1818436 [Artomyces pyxidatus]|uniref:Uncharacterized protein n=1 Tax=Artomyces pyxidatus TaxID=48021 RepID=A0ACB8THY7_9AGAM|nr:hypothetical protein BV25DRAFT_1818436 [Artomyces pyxidatus]